MYGVMLYHNQPRAIYRDEWIEACMRSIGEQTYQSFHVIEVDYGGLGSQLFPGSEFVSHTMENFAEATNYLLDLGRKRGYQGMFNVHLDDVYARDRFEKQVAALKQGYDLVSSNFYQTDAEGNVTHAFQFDHLDAAEELAKGHNILCNPVIAFSERWLREASRYDPADVPFEDMKCWERNLNMNMIVLPDMLCYKRFHPNEASNSENR